MMTIQELEKQYIINTYNRVAGKTPCLVKGEGSYVRDEKGKEYLDFLSGLAVNVLGHCHPAVVKAIGKQASELIHTSNLYFTEPQVRLAEALVESMLPGGKVFFANSGAEVNEAAIKLARKYKPGCFKIVSAENSFHGRTMGALSATGQPKHSEAFKPLLEGFSFAPFNDIDSFRGLIDEKTAAVIIEPVQGEGGVYVGTEQFMKGLREACDRWDVLLIFDEVQCGVGRTGKLWAFEHRGVKPDLVTVAKGLGGGMPLGALVVGERFAGTLKPGEHASTFGGNPVSCSAALAVLQIVGREDFLEEVTAKGAILAEGLIAKTSESPALLKECRGLGLICAVELEKPLAGLIQEKCTEKGLLVNAIGERILRFLPPLNLLEEELKTGLEIYGEVLEELQA